MHFGKTLLTMPGPSANADLQKKHHDCNKNYLHIDGKLRSVFRAS